MTVPTVAVSFVATDPDGKPAAGDIFRAQLDKTDIHPAHGFVVPELVEAVAGADGLAVLHLWSNELGTESTRYRFVALNPERRQKYLDVTALVPNRACNLHEIAALPNPLNLQSP